MPTAEQLNAAETAVGEVFDRDGATFFRDGLSPEQMSDFKREVSRAAVHAALPAKQAKAASRKKK